MKFIIQKMNSCFLKISKFIRIQNFVLKHGEIEQYSNLINLVSDSESSEEEINWDVFNKISLESNSGSQIQ